MRKLFMVLLVCLVPAAVFSKEAPEQILLSLPEKVGPFEAEAPVTYDRPELGASRGYNAYKYTDDYVALTLYIYDFGFDEIEDGITSKAIIEAKQDAKRVMDYFEVVGNYLDVEITKDTEVEFNIGRGKSIKVIDVSYRYRKTDSKNSGEAEPVNSDLIMVGLGGHVCKIRVTRSTSINQEIEAEIKDMIQTLLKLLSNRDIQALYQ